MGLALASVATQRVDQVVSISDSDGFRGRCIRCHLPISRFFWYSVCCEKRHSEANDVERCMIVTWGCHDAMDGTSNAIGHLEWAGATNLPDVDDRTGAVKYGWNE